MKLDFKLFKKLLVVLGVLAPIAFVLRIYTYWKELDVTTGFFSNSGIGSSIFNWIGFAVFFLCLFCTWRKGGSFVGSATAPIVSSKRDEDEDLLMQNEEVQDAEEDFPEFFLHGFSKKCAIWFGTFSAFAALLPGFGLLSHALSFLVDKENLSDPYTLVYAALAFFSGAFFLLYAFRNSSERSRSVAFFALIPAFWCTVRMIIEYRDLARFLNKSLYIGQFLFVISALVFLLNQAEILLGEDKLSRPNAYVFSGAAVVFFGLTARLPQLFAIMGSLLKIDLYTSTALLADLALTVFVASKLAVTAKRR